MVNNPFRGKPISNAQQNIEEWGKVKFKPTKFGSGGKNNFKNHQGGKGINGYNRKFGNRNGNSNNNKDTHNFNQLAKNAKPENATPWSKYKDEIVSKQREEEKEALQADMDSKGAKQALKQREINYRKLLIEQKKQEPTQWEDFADDDNTNSLKKEGKNSKSLEETNSTTKNKELKAINKNKKSLGSKSKINLKKNITNSRGKGEVRDFIPQELLNNFDSRKLSFKQNDKMRKIITKTTAMAFGSSLKMTIDDMKRKKLKKHN